MESSLCTNLAGVNASVHVACTEHAVIQRVSVHVRSFAFLLGDEENASVQQLVGAVPLWDGQRDRNTPKVNSIQLSSTWRTVDFVFYINTETAL